MRAEPCGLLNHWSVASNSLRLAALHILANNARPLNCVALQGEDCVYRVRVGDYWIVYEVLDSVLVIHVVRIGHRREVYR